MKKVIVLLSLIMSFSVGCKTPTSDSTTPTPTDTTGASPTPASVTLYVDIQGIYGATGTPGYYPQNLEINVGTTIVWTNQDTAAHSVTADGGFFDSGALKTADSFEWTFLNSGTFTYHSSVTGDTMTGAIKVDP